MKEEEIEAIAGEILKDVNGKILQEVRSNEPKKGLVGITKTGEEVLLEYIGSDAYLHVEEAGEIKQDEEVKVDLAYRALKRVINEFQGVYFHLSRIELRGCRMIPYTEFRKRE